MGTSHLHGPRLYLKIAGISIAVIGAAPGLECRIAGAMRPFVVDDTEPDMTLHVSWRELGEENDGEKLFDSGCVWQLYAEEDAYRFRFVSPALGARPYKVARVTPDFTSGEIVLHRPYFPPGQAVFPLEYPLDELLLLHLLAQGRGVEMHACGVVDAAGRGHLFLGQSGAGKTTMTRLWLAAEAVTILSDDRIILRHVDQRLWMYGTPWHGEAGLAEAARVPVTRIYFLQHGQTNALVPQRTVEAVGRLFACTFPPFYNPKALDFTLGVFEQIATTIPCDVLHFVPDARVVTFLRQKTDRHLDNEHCRAMS